MNSGRETKIKVHDGFFGVGRVDLMVNGKKQEFSTAQVYGYRDAKGQDYRFFNRGIYRILDTTGFYLYSYSKTVLGGKTARQQTVYYFSLTASDIVQMLRLANLESAFVGNAPFSL